MDRGSWQATVHGVTKESDTTEQLNNNNTTGLTAVTSREQTYGHGELGRKERVGCMKRVTWKLALLYVTYNSGNSNQGSVIT